MPTSQPLDYASRVNRLICLAGFFFIAFGHDSMGTAYYVNDASTNGNVYSTAVGSDANNGLTPATPKFTVTNLTATYSLNPGDIVYIDTGTYSNYSAVVNKSGVPTNHIVFQGSTNYAAGGSVFVRNDASDDVWALFSVSNVTVRHVTMRGGRDGLLISSSTDVNIERVNSRNNSRHGVYMFPNNTRIYFRNSIFADNSGYAVRSQLGISEIMIDNCVLWGNYGLHCDNYSLVAVSVSNSVLRASGTDAAIYRRTTPIVSDYNVYVLENNAVMSTIVGPATDSTPRLSDWQATYNMDWHSTSLDPQFADPANHDFHLRSAFGRYQPSTGTFTNDAVTSPLIDMGYRFTAFSFETTPNGSRVNAGSYGNTVEASRSSTNRTLLALTFNDGGILTGPTGRVYWVAGNAGPSDTVRLEYSANGGITWSTVVTNVPATNETTVWNSTLFASSGAGKWRIRYETVPFTNIVSTNTGYFSLKNSNLVFYVNDLSTTGDLFTTAVGSPSNNGSSSNSPRDSLSGILTNHTVSGGDTIYIDSGTYILSNSVAFSPRQRGLPGNPVRVIGAKSNGEVGGPVFNRQSILDNTFSVFSSPHMYFENLDIRGGASGAFISLSEGVTLNRCILRENHDNGITFGLGSPNGAVRNSLIIDNLLRALTVSATNISLINNTIYGVRGMHLDASGSAHYENNIARVSSVAAAVFESINGSFINTPDYNLFYLEDGAALARVGIITYLKLADYQKAYNREWHSTITNPQFVDTTNYNFHVRSEQGHWNGVTWTNNLVTAISIDLGKPSAAFSNEVAPNGSRINSGAYGNTTEASRSRTNSWLTVLSYVDGGVLNVPGESVYWNYGAFPTGATVRVELSTDSGGTWSIAATNIAVTNQFYSWANTNFASSRFALWRVVYEANTNVLSATTSNFVFRNGPFVYFINNNSTVGDIYTTAQGSDSNLGTSPGAPKFSLKSVFDTHTVQAGDIVYADTGTYTFPVDQLITALDSGDTNNFIYILGSTNQAAGGTVFTRVFNTASEIGINLTGAAYYWIKNITLRNCGSGITLNSSTGTRLERVRVFDNILSGISANSSDGIRIINSATWRNGLNGIEQLNGGHMSINHAVIWNNGASGIRINAGTFAISNSVIVAGGVQSAAYQLSSLSSVTGNYNNILVQTQAVVAVITTPAAIYDSLASWILATGQDTMSLSEDPLFANTSAGDFHLKTEATGGRFLPGGGFTVDSDTSVLIDAGAPGSTFTNEPSPNGSRVNIGMFGNTEEASRSVTNASLLTASLRRGGPVSGTANLHWVAYNLPTSHLVRVSFSRDGGGTWSIIASNVSATAESVSWNTTVVSNSPAGLWRVESQTNPSLIDQTTTFFSIRNAPLKLYVNNASTAGDVYTSAQGSSTNWEAAANRPANSLSMVIQRYNLEPGDVVYIDTGIYSSPSLTWGRYLGGSTSLPIVLIGSTNMLSGGAVLQGTGLSAGTHVLSLSSTRNITLSNLVIRNANSGLIIDGTEGVKMNFISSSANSNGVIVRASTNVLVRRSTIVGNYNSGIINQGADLTNRIEHSVILSNGVAGILQTSGRLDVENSVLSAYGSSAFIYQILSNANLRADYNNVLIYSNANVAQFGFSISKNLVRWQQLQTNDLHSLSHEPYFANPSAGDYHIQSPAGRYDPGSGTFLMTDTDRSPMLDAGNPASAFSLETTNNGGRVNIGLYGNHQEASRSPTNGWLYTLTVNDGGSIRDTVALYWQVGGSSTGSLVYLDYSADSGLTWTNIATNVNASAGSVSWNTLPYQSSAQARWRIVDQSNPAIAATNTVLFSLNNLPLAYYVNDASTSNDVYTTAPGNPNNDGLTESTPLDSIKTLLDRRNMQPGDRILVDTGEYLVTNTIAIDFLSYSGVATNPLQIIGSTNWVAGGSRISRNNESVLFLLDRVQAVHISHFAISNAVLGVRVNQSTNTLLQWLDIRGGGTGIELIGSEATTMRYNSIRETTTNALANLLSTGTVWQSGVFWSNVNSIVLSAPLISIGSVVPQNQLTVSNSIFVAYGSDATVYRIGEGQLSGDYNNIQLTNGAFMARVSGGFYNTIYDSLAMWRERTGKDVSSLSSEPVFVDPSAGNFHLRSEGGRINTLDGSFVIDGVSSPLIDAGAPAAAFTNETAPNGGRINIGLHGGTPLASRTPSNAAATFLSLNDGGIISGTNTIRWLARGAATGHNFRIDVSVNGGATFENVTTNVLGGALSLLWNTTLHTSTVRGVLRILDTTVTNVLDSTDKFFSIRNQPISFYVNDLSTTGDVYTSTVGIFTNSGLSPSAPKLQLIDILDAWDVESGDIIYIDTGSYSNDALTTLSQLDSGSPTSVNPVVVQGSTNIAAGGTKLFGSSTNVALRLFEVSQVSLRNLNISGADRPLIVRRGENINIDQVRINGGFAGVELDGSRHVDIANSIIENASDRGLMISGSSNVVWRSGVLWSNRVALFLTVSTNYLGTFVAQQNIVSLSNSVLGVFGASAFAFDARVLHTLRSDYNSIYRVNGAQVATTTSTNSVVPILYNSINRWSALAGNDTHSQSAVNPGFADPINGDYHPLSTVGRFSPTSGVFVLDSTNSPLIDTGGPDHSFSNETSPNGGRINIGAYGNTPQASRSATNSFILMLSFNDGGVAFGTNQLISWVSRGNATGHTKRIFVSVDGGLTWTNIATNIASGANSLIWNTTNYPSTPAALLRIEDEQETGIVSTTLENFAIRNGPLKFYANDQSATGDVYTTSIGSTTNLGITPIAPMATLQGILSRWDLTAGDTVYIDTGTYTNPSTIFFNQFDSGGFSNAVKVIIQGSTNEAAGGTLISQVGGTSIQIIGAGGIALKNLRINGAATGIKLKDAEGIDFEWVDVSNTDTAYDIEDVQNIRFNRCVARSVSAKGMTIVEGLNVSWKNGVMWSMPRAMELFASADIGISNSVFGLFITNAPVYQLVGSIPGFTSQQNNFYLLNGAIVGTQLSTMPVGRWRSVADWVRRVGLDSSSLSHDPLFVDPNNGDFHLKSQAGRFQVTSGVFVVDAETSPLIDAGHSADSFSLETANNGRRRNIGLYGDTVQASRTPTNAALTVVSLNDVGRVEGIKELIWVPRGDSTGHTVRLEYSSNDGVTWVSIATNLLSSSGRFIWDTRQFVSSIQARWRISSEQNTNVFDVCDRRFALRNTGLNFYVNDGSTAGDMYTSAIGLATNLGILSSSPNSTIQNVLNRWDIDPGDTIYMDTGNYVLTAPIQFSTDNAWPELTNLSVLASGYSTNRVLIQGSTNEVGGGSSISIFGAGDLIQITNAPGVAISHLNLQGGGSGIRMLESPYSRVEWVRRLGGAIGFSVTESPNSTFRHNVIKATTSRGFNVQDSIDTVWENGILWSNTTAFFQDGGLQGESGLSIENSLVGVFGSNSVAHFNVSGEYLSDYNNIYLVNGALAAAFVRPGSIVTTRFESVSSWSRETGQDTHSLARNPELANVNVNDFHLKTTQVTGRFDSINNVWTNDLTFSRMIDAGNPSADFENETQPNGGRINIDLYGNNSQASKTPTNDWLSVASFYDDASIQGTVKLTWHAGGGATGHLVHIDFSPVGDLAWTNVVSNLVASVESYDWVTTNFGKAACGRWRIVSENSTSVYDISKGCLTLRDNSGSIPYFVNDASTIGDVYSTAPGSVFNSGTLPSSPMRSVQDVINTYRLEPVDIIYIDTGVYLLADPVEINDLDSGFGTNRITLQGSTNYAAGGSILDRQVVQSGKPALQLVNASGLTFRDLSFRNGVSGVIVENSEDITFINARAFENGESGFTFEKSVNIELLNSLAWNNGSITNGSGLTVNQSEISVNNSVIWDNYLAVLPDRSNVAISNSILGASFDGGRVYYFGVESSISSVQGNFNNYFVQSGARLAEKVQLAGGNDYYRYLQDWVSATGQDMFTLTHEPDFVDSTNGDFHVRSEYGRFTIAGSLTNDTSTSWMIDTGNPLSGFTNEPSPNGDRINIGMHGNTARASLSTTNPWVLAISYNDGGVVKGDTRLVWTSGNLPPAERVRLELSRNGGAEWFLIASNIVNSTGIYVWDASNEQVTSQGKWRVVSESNESLWDDTDSLFAIKNNTLTIYVNDESTQHDVYSTVPGEVGNTGLSNNAPLLLVRDAFTKYPLGPDDTIYIDTGSYSVSNALVLNEISRGETGKPIRVIGSTSVSNNSTLLFFGGAGLSLTDTSDIEVEGLRFFGASNGIQIVRTDRVLFRDVNSSYGVNGLNFLNAREIEFDRSILAENSAWGVNASASSVSFENGIIYSNQLGAIFLQQVNFDVNNSILHANNVTSFIYRLRESSVGQTDYNIIWMPTTNATLARVDDFTLSIFKMSEWIKYTGGADIHSALINPSMNNAAAGDYTLMSKAGRFSTNGVIVIDGVNSWAIDAGNPASEYNNELQPNGSRINVGHRGNTSQASLSSTNPADRAFFASSHVDGGTGSGEIPLYWLSAAFSPTSSVRIEYSLNDKLTWEVAVTNYPNTDGFFLWNASDLLSSPLVWWKVISEENTNVWDEAGPFTIRNGPIVYYVNDTGTFGDVKTTAPGSETNNALAPESPQLNIQTVINAYDLEGGDVVYIDTGNHILEQQIFVSLLDGGLSTDLVHFVGSDNFQAGGTVYQPSTNFTNSVAFAFAGVQFAAIDKVVLDGFNTGIRLFQGSSGNFISNVLVRDGESDGISFELSDNNHVRRTVVTRQGGYGINSSISPNNFVQNSVLWSNELGAVSVSSSTLSLSNSVLSAISTNYVYFLRTNSTIVSDFNLYQLGPDASFAFADGLVYERVPQWVYTTFQDTFSLHTDPKFADAANDDYHPQSFMGRFDPGTSLFMTTDTNISLQIDFGPPPWDYGLEPSPNGTKINIGSYANTAQASKSRTNAWIKTITGMGGGRLEGILLLSWNFNNIAENEEVILDYSYDNGISWTNIGTNVISAMAHLWQSDQKYPGNVERWVSSPIGRWKITLSSNTNVYDITENYFALRNKLFVFYINDSNTVGDVYTTGPGSCTNLGIFIHAPSASLSCLFDTLDVEGEDVILIDTGIYNFETEEVWELSPADQGKSGLPVIILGSTNNPFSVLDRPIAGSVNELIKLNGQHVDLAHLRFRRGGLVSGGNTILHDLVFTNSGTVMISGPNGLVDNFVMDHSSLAANSVNAQIMNVRINHGSITMTGTNNTLLNSLVYGTNTTPALYVEGFNILVQNNTLANQGSSFVQKGFGGSIVRNNILVADGFDRYCIDAQTGTLESDFNTLYTLNTAWIGGYRNGNWEHLYYWQREAGQDLNSIAGNPLFANASAGDYRLRSKVGRWNGSTWVTDTNHSSSIDAGSPQTSFALEPMPNGSSANHGFDGNTALASLSLTNAWLLTMTMNDGGVFKGTNLLVWRSGNMTNGSLLQLDYSSDNGATWTTIVTGVSASQTNYLWNSSPYPSSFNARWKVTLISNTNVYDVTEKPFALRNVALTFYIDDTSNAGDVYTSSTGNDANDGMSPSTPKLTLQSLLAAYDTEGGDIIYIDTGAYPVTNLNRVIWSRGGDTNYGPMVIQGSTNLAAGGSVFTRNISSIGNHVLEVPASFVSIRDLTMQGGYYGVFASSNRTFTAKGIFSKSNEWGMLLNTSFDVHLKNLRIWNNRQGGIEVLNGRTTVLENVTFAANSNFSYRLVGTVDDVIQNNIFYQSWSNTPAFSGPSNSFISAFIDYNVYFFAEPTSTIYETFTTLLPWQVQRGKDYRSAITNPLLNNVASGDLHLKSASGRYSGGAFVNDAESSWAIDRGNPASGFTNETAFNGGRINIGAFGNTPFASRSSTNQVLETRILNDGATIDDNSLTNIIPLIWGTINLPTGLVVNVQFSGDGGTSWSNIQTGVSVYQEYVLWQATPLFNTYKGLWRVIGQDGPVNYSVTNNSPITIFFGEFEISQIFKTAPNNRNNIVWRGAWDEYYQVQQSDNGFLWTNSISGAGTNQSAYFLTTRGGDFTFQDITSTNINLPDRLYRVIWVQFDPFADLDNDNMVDLWEIANFNSITNSDGSQDFDGDGLSDLAEFISNTEPTNWLSALQLESISQLSSNTFKITWTSVDGIEYDIGYASPEISTNITSILTSLGVGPLSTATVQLAQTHRILAVRILYPEQE